MFVEESLSHDSNSFTYREGMIVEPTDDGRIPDPPEGFNIFKNESGIMTLRKKRNRKIGTRIHTNFFTIFVVDVSYTHTYTYIHHLIML